YSPAGQLALHHRKLMPTNHERLVWGLGDGKGLETVTTDLGKVGGLICWENLMPLARAALYEDGVEIYLAPTADDSEDWHDSMKHIARESRAFVLSCCVFQRASSYPKDVPLAEGDELVGGGGSAILAPDGSYLAGPLWNEEGILYADLIRSSSTKRDSGSTRPATTAGPICCGSKSARPLFTSRAAHRGGARARRRRVA